MNVIVTTTIHPPTAAIEMFQAMPGWHLVVVGDHKTPTGYHLHNGTYVSPEDQEKYDSSLSAAIGWNCIQRRNFGFLWAKDMGAEIVATVDDDNKPLSDWGENLLIGREVEMNYYMIDHPAFDPVGATNHGYLWHRGFPLQLIGGRDYSYRTRRAVIADVQADFWNGDPDIDAICRMEHAPTCEFDDACFPFAANKMGPFNSQNTFLAASVLRDYFMFPHVGRMDDIWGSFYAQAVGHKVVWNKASVHQIRNVHDPVQDMKQEYVGYEKNLNLVQDMANDAGAIRAYLPDRALLAFDLYRRHFDL